MPLLVFSPTNNIIIKDSYVFLSLQCLYWCFHQQKRIVVKIDCTRHWKNKQLVKTPNKGVNYKTQVGKVVIE